MKKKYIKCVLIGDGYIGKTCMLVKLENPELNIQNMVDENIMYQFEISDTGGGDEYDRFRPLYYPFTQIILLCYAIDQPQSFERITTKYLPEIKEHLPDIPIFLIATKIDLRNNNETIERLNKQGFTPINREDGERFCDELNLQRYMECSAALNENIKEVFDEAFQYCIENMKSSSRKCIIS